MHSISREVQVDSAKAVVAAYSIANNAFFLVSATASVDGWIQILDQKIQGIWLLGLPSTNPEVSQPNAWKIGMELKSGRIITFELYDTKTERGTVFLVRTLVNDTEAKPIDDFKKLKENGVCVTGRCMNPNVMLKDTILKMRDAGLFSYQLVNGRGHRYWVRLALDALEPFIPEPRRVKHFNVGADETMRQCWLEGGGTTGAYGFEDEPDHILHILPGEYHIPN